METYKITWKTHWTHIWTTILYLIIVIATFVSTKSGIIFAVMGGGFLTQLIPQVILHMNYYAINKQDVFSIDPTSKEIRFSHNSVDYVFNVDQINRLILYKSFALQRRSIQLWFLDSYNYGVIVLEDGKRIVITSLLIGGEFQLPIDESKIEVQNPLFRWVKGPSVQLPS